MRPIPQPEPGQLKAIHIDHDFIIVDKPTELTVHPTAKRATGTLSNMLVARFPTLTDVGEAHRPGIVHRLDRDVSGVMMVAANHEAYEYFKKQFAEHKVNKEYTAVVLGKIGTESGTITATLGRTKKGLMSVVPNGLPAITHWEVLRRGVRTTLLKVIIETGRMHQIRVHLRHLGHPIVGDTLYGKRNAPVKSARLLLHATKISFIDLQGKQRVFESALPTEFLTIP